MLAEGYDVLPVADGATALAQIVRRPIVLVITDQRMPGTDGVTLTGAIKAARPRCPIVLLSGNLTPELEQRARAAGAAFALPKPFSFAQIATMVQAVLPH
jgi:two-component system chemotaxis response regulator CheY